MNLADDKNQYKKLVELKVDTLIKLEHYQEAINFLKQENEDERVYEIIIGLGLATDDFDLVKSYSNKLINDNASNEDAYIALGTMYYKREKYNKAIKKFIIALNLSNVSSKQALMGIVDIYLYLDNLDKAEKYLNILKSKHRGYIPSMFAQARLEYKKGNNKKSYQILKVLKKYDGSKKLFDFYKEVKNSLNKGDDNY